MARKENEIPSYRFFRARNCGKAVFGTSTVYFPGRFGSEESLEAYRRAIADWCSTGLSPKQIAARQTKTTVNDLALAFVKEYVQVRYVKRGTPTTEQRSFATALRPVRLLYGTTPVNGFSPKCLVACRQRLIDAGFTRKRINQHVGRIRHMFRWGVSRELVAETVWRALGAVDGLRKGEGGTERPKIKPVPEWAIDAIQPYVTPPIWAMIQIQLASAARPGEVVQMRTCDLFTAADCEELPPTVAGMCHAFRPSSHKTEHHDKERLILLGPSAWAAIERWLRPDSPERNLFSPAEARAWYFASRRKEAKSPRKRPRPKKQNPKRQPTDFYSEGAYCRAIGRAVQKANVARTAEAKKGGVEPQEVPHWHPNQLRHNAATRLRKQFGLDVAKIILGHSYAATTEIYAEPDLERAARAVAESG